MPFINVLQCSRFAPRNCATLPASNSYIRNNNPGLVLYFSKLRLKFFNNGTWQVISNMGTDFLVDPVGTETIIDSGNWYTCPDIGPTVGANYSISTSITFSLVDPLSYPNFVSPAISNVSLATEPTIEARAVMYPDPGGEVPAEPIAWVQYTINIYNISDLVTPLATTDIGLYVGVFYI